MRNMGIVRANPRRCERASSIVWFARFCSFLVSSRVTTSGTIASIVSSTMARMFVLNAPFPIGDGRRLWDLDGLPAGDLALLCSGQLVEDLLDVLGVPEDAGDVREQQVRQEPAAHNLAGLEHLREGEDLGGVELDH